MVTKDGRYLLQLRDNRRGLALYDHWVLFGGQIEPGETAAATLRRELDEELGFELRVAHWYTEAIHVLPRADLRVVRRVFFVVPVAESDVASMVQREGAAMRLLDLAEILALAHVSPWDLTAIVMHARSERLFAI